MKMIAAVLLILIVFLFKFNSKKNTDKLKNTEIVIEKNDSIKSNNIQKLIKLTLNNNDAKKLNIFLSKLSKEKNVDFSNEGEMLVSEELIDYIYNEHIYFFGYYDWKARSSNVEDYIRKSLKKNFNKEFGNKNVCDLNELSSIDLVYKLYGVELDKMGYTLCSIDTESDSYTILLIEKENYEKFKNAVNNLTDFTPKHYTDQW